MADAFGKHFGDRRGSSPAELTPGSVVYYVSVMSPDRVVPQLDVREGPLASEDAARRIARSWAADTPADYYIAVDEARVDENGLVCIEDSWHPPRA